MTAEHKPHSEPFIVIDTARFLTDHPENAGVADAIKLARAYVNLYEQLHSAEARLNSGIFMGQPIEYWLGLKEQVEALQAFKDSVLVPDPTVAIGGLIRERDSLKEQQQSALETAHRWQEEAIAAGHELNALKEQLESVIGPLQQIASLHPADTDQAPHIARRTLDRVGANPASVPNQEDAPASRQSDG